MKLPNSGAANAVRESLRSVNPEAWVDQHGDYLYRYALIRVRRPEVAEDLVQETLFAALRTYTSFRGTSSERGWLCGILRNKICDHFREHAREVSYTDLEFLRDEMSHKFIGQDWNHDLGPAEWKPNPEAALDIRGRAHKSLIAQLCANGVEPPLSTPGSLEASVRERRVQWPSGLSCGLCRHRRSDP